MTEYPSNDLVDPSQPITVAGGELPTPAELNGASIYLSAFKAGQVKGALKSAIPGATFNTFDGSTLKASRDKEGLALLKMPIVQEAFKQDVLVLLGNQHWNPVSKAYSPMSRLRADTKNGHVWPQPNLRGRKDHFPGDTTDPVYPLVGIQPPWAWNAPNPHHENMVKQMKKELGYEKIYTDAPGWALTVRNAGKKVRSRADSGPIMEALSAIPDSQTLVIVDGPKGFNAPQQMIPTVRRLARALEARSGFTAGLFARAKANPVATAMIAGALGLGGYSLTVGNQS